jgi:hypothetical protein
MFKLIKCINSIRSVEGHQWIQGYYFQALSVLQQNPELADTPSTELP